MRKIDADALQEKWCTEMCRKMPGCEEDCAYWSYIHSAPTIEEPIMCKDCIWWTKADASLQGRCSMFGIYPTGTWYCANAERKEVAEE